MSLLSAFQPSSSLNLVTNAAAVQVTGVGIATSYRIRNLSSTPQYIKWGRDSTITAPTAPTAGVPQAATIGMLPNSVETFNLPAGSWFIADNATGFEVQAGEGV